MLQRAVSLSKHGLCKADMTSALSLSVQLLSVDGVTVYGPKPEQRGSPLCTFNVEGVHPTDLSTFLDFEGKE